MESWQDVYDANADKYKTEVTALFEKHNITGGGLSFQEFTALIGDTMLGQKQPFSTERLLDMFDEGLQLGESQQGEETDMIPLSAILVLTEKWRLLAIEDPVFVDVVARELSLASKPSQSTDG